MTDTTTTTEETAPATASGGAEGTAATPDPVAEIEKWKALSRKHEADARKNADAARRLADIEASQMSEQEKTAARIKELETQNSSLATALARKDAAIAVGLPLEFADRLQGSTPEELVADAEKLKSVVAPSKTPPATFDGGPRGEPPQPPQDGNNWLRAAVDAKRGG